ncbi:MAG: anthranilate phosphoribosyltransferase [Candidatus Omnitrophica bacterium]|nr:anthranilate phosphoribosyltransferase [Candidatus Omnitrophota bacterium]
MIEEAIKQLVEKKDLTAELVGTTMEEIMTGQAHRSQLAAYLALLRIKGETVEEITASTEVMRRHVTKISSSEEIILDTCGTGGDSSGTFNVSTISALVAVGAGIVVAKHGNRSVSSKCGSADLLVQLGVRIDLSPEAMQQCLQEIGFSFLYAPLLHPAMQYATPVRREIGIRTIFNILGPLTNPAGASNQLLGVYNASLTEVLAGVLKNLGSRHVLVVHGEDGLDEVTTTGKTKISELKDGKIKTYQIKPGQFGIKPVKPEELKGGDPTLNARIAYDILKGRGEAKRDAVLLNAGCAIYAADQAASIQEGVIKAAESIDSGKALEKLELLKQFTNK